MKTPSGQSSTARRLDDRPAAALEHVDVLLPLPQGQRRVDGAGARDVRHEPVREARGGSADEREATVHALTLGRALRWTAPGGSATVGRATQRAVACRNGLDPHAT